MNVPQLAKVNKSNNQGYFWPDVKAANEPQLAKVNKTNKKDFFFGDFSWPNELLVQNFYLISDAHIHNI